MSNGFFRPPSATGGGGPTPRYVPKIATPAPPRKGSGLPAMTADYAERVYVPRLLSQQQEQVNQFLPDVGGLTEEDLIAMLGGGAATGGGGGGGGGVRRMAAPRWSQADVDKLTAAGQTARTNIGGAWDAASAQLQKLMADYAAADAARRQGAAQTLGAFGAPTAQDVGGMSAADVLASMLGQSQVSKAAELANQDALLQAYTALLGQVK